MPAPRCFVPVFGCDAVRARPPSLHLPACSPACRRLDIDPEYMAANRAKGKASDRDELGMIESSIAYGCGSATHVATQPHACPRQAPCSTPRRVAVPRSLPRPRKEALAARALAPSRHPLHPCRPHPPPFPPYGPRMPRPRVHFKARADGSYEVTLVSVPDRVFILALVGGVPRLQTTLGGKAAYVSRVYVESKVRRAPAPARLFHGSARRSGSACRSPGVMSPLGSRSQSRTVTVTLCVPCVLCVDGVPAVFQERFIGPKVLYVDLFGVCLHAAIAALPPPPLGSPRPLRVLTPVRPTLCSTVLAACSGGPTAPLPALPLPPPPPFLLGVQVWT
jgi:hypothetical protein